MLTKNRVATALAEFLATTALVLVALVLTQTTNVSYFIATSLALALAAIVMIFGSISGAHVNPAITFALWTARKIGTLKAITYVAVQILGALAAWQLFQYLTGNQVAAKDTNFTTPLWLAEVVGTFVLALGFTAVLSRVLDSLHAGFVVGATYFASIMIASSGAAGYLNPALALGLRDWNAAYVLGPLVGALLATNLYYLLFAPSSVVKRTVVRKKR